jgi:lipopolysaccharide biosynthesis regulator YciM
MYEEKRTAGEPVPENVEDLLNEAQLLVLEKMQRLGWELKFIRRTTPQDILPVLFHPHINKTGILEADGTLNTQPEVRLRETDQAVLISCPRCGYMIYGRLWRCPGCGGSGYV